MRGIVWVTGRAAAGKSTVIMACVARLRSCGYEPAVLSDEQLLFRLKETDGKHRHHYHPYGDHRFLFRDGYLFDEGLRWINAWLLKEIATGSPRIVLWSWRGGWWEGSLMSLPAGVDLVDRGDCGDHPGRPGRASRGGWRAVPPLICGVT